MFAVRGASVEGVYVSHVVGYRGGAAGHALGALGTWPHEEMNCSVT